MDKRKTIKQLPDATIQQIIEDYKSNVSLRQLEQKYNVGRVGISKYLTEIGVKTTVGNHYRKYFHDFNYFEVIDNEEKAYWLGFIFADGYIQSNTTSKNSYGEDAIGISLAEEDSSHLEKFKTSINSTNPITVETKTVGQPMHRILLRSQKTVDDLILHGCYKNKSHILEPPKNVPDYLIVDFIRGFFDGDGSLTKIKTKENCKNIYGINITTTLSMAEWIKEVYGKGSVVKDSRREFSYYYSLGGNLQVKDFCKWLYQDATIFLDRKFNRFLELLSEYNESWGMQE